MYYNWGRLHGINTQECIKSHVFTYCWKIKAYIFLALFLRCRTEVVNSQRNECKQTVTNDKLVQNGFINETHLEMEVIRLSIMNYSWWFISLLYCRKQWKIFLLGSFCNFRERGGKERMSYTWYMQAVLKKR